MVLSGVHQKVKIDCTGRIKPAQRSSPIDGGDYQRERNGKKRAAKGKKNNLS